MTFASRQRTAWRRYRATAPETAQHPDPTTSGACASAAQMPGRLTLRVPDYHFFTSSEPRFRYHAGVLAVSAVSVRSVARRVLNCRAHRGRGAAAGIRPGRRAGTARVARHAPGMSAGSGWHGHAETREKRKRAISLPTVRSCICTPNSRAISSRRSIGRQRTTLCRSGRPCSAGSSKRPKGGIRRGLGGRFGGRRQRRSKIPRFLRLFAGMTGGGSGIRTHGTLLTHTRFPSVRLKPLGHPSGVGAKIPAASGSASTASLRRPS